MTSKSRDIYPGENASMWQILDLANAYYTASMTLFEKAQRELPLSYAPARWCCIHSIELYLNAFLRHDGVPPEQIRGRTHNLSDPDFVARIKLRKRTAQHLIALTERREYLISRYAPELMSRQSELNRLTATLVEVAMKVGRYVAS